jgi:phosphoribosyl 1,2-cyclic phosphodiesterase
MLAKSLEPSHPIEAYWFFTHYHWDHIQGVPFFTPAFIEGNTLHIHGSAPEGTSMAEHFCKRVLHTESPVPTKALKADLKYYDLVCGDSMKLDDIIIETTPLNHPNGAMGYRVTWQGHSAFYCTDTEHFADRIDENVLHLARDADVVIYDAMYTDEEYHNPKSPKVGWGHSTWQEGVKAAKEAGAKRLAIFHHEPGHNDDFLDNLEVEVKNSFEGGFLAREGMSVRIS